MPAVDAIDACVPASRPSALAWPHLLRTASALPWPRLQRTVLAALMLGVAGVNLTGCVSSAGITSSAQPLSPAAVGLTAADVADAAAPAPDWWRALGAPDLDALMQRALADSPSLALAQARLERAQAVVAGVDASAGAQVGASADATRQRFSANSIYPPPLGGSVRTLANAQLSAGWNLDFFGRNHAALAAALGAERASTAELAAARALLGSTVARGYVQLGHLFALRAVAQRTLQQRQDMLVLIRQRVAAGLDLVLEERQGEGALPDARAQIEQIDEQIMLARHALAVLTAQPPHALDALAVTLADLHRMDLPAVLPADLMGRRADIVAARWRVQAAIGDAELARAQFYPDIDLNAFIGLSSIGLGRLIEAGAMQAGIGPAIRLPIFDSGRLRAQLRVKNADLDAAVESYNTLVRDGVREVVDQLGSLQSIARQQREQAQAHAAAQAAHELVAQRYQAGLAGYLAVLDAESRLLVQRRSAADLAARSLDSQIALVRALGGGYVGEPAGSAQREVVSSVPQRLTAAPKPVVHN